MSTSETTASEQPPSTRRTPRPRRKVVVVEGIDDYIGEVFVTIRVIDDRLVTDQPT